MSQEQIKIKGTFPDGPLYRFFSKDEYALDFFNGCIRLGWLTKYSQMEGDVRGDTTEGTAEYTFNDPNQLSITIDRNTGKEINRTKKPGITNVSSSSINEFYILCASEVTDKINLTQLRNRFSENSPLLPRYVIIGDVKNFTEIIAKTLEESEYCQYIMGLIWFKVEYSKGQNRTKHEPDLYLDVYQKPAFVDKKDYPCEHEWRLAECLKGKGSLLRIKNASKVMFLTGEERLKRIAKYVHMTVAELPNSPAILARYKDEAPLWIEYIIINASPGIQSCTRLLK